MRRVPIPLCHTLNHLPLPSPPSATQLFNFLYAVGGGGGRGTESLMHSIIPCHVCHPLPSPTLDSSSPPFPFSIPVTHPSPRSGPRYGTKPGGVVGSANLGGYPGHQLSSARETDDEIAVFCAIR